MSKLRDAASLVLIPKNLYYNRAYSGTMNAIDDSTVC